MYKNLKQTLSLYHIDCNKPYYISLDSPNLKTSAKQLGIDFYAVCICTSGSISLEIDNKEYELVENNFLISGPSTIIRYRNISKACKMQLLLFEKNFLLKNLSDPFIIEKMIFFQNDTYAVVHAEPEVLKNLSRILIYLKEKSSGHGQFKDEIIRTIIFNLLLEIAEITSENTSKNEDSKNAISDIYLEFRKLIFENILDNKSVQFYADKLNISNKYLIEIVKKSTKKTPHEVIDDILLKEAYVLLGDTSLSISEVAYKLQFNSVSAFGRFFKKQVAISPSAYRIKENLTH